MYLYENLFYASNDKLICLGFYSSPKKVGTIIIETNK